MRWRAWRALGALAVGALVALVVDVRGSGAEPVIGPGLVRVEVDIRYSLFELDDLRVRRGTTVEFVLRNTDPIHHEFIVGDTDVHARHARGTEARHPPVPGEVSIPPHRVASTAFTFDEPGEVEYACHLPGHYRHGMRGTITVVG